MRLRPSLVVAAAAAASTPPTSDRRLVFLIGPNKTGTRSWAELLSTVYGLRVLHDAGAWSKASRAHDAAFFEGPYDAFADGDNFDVAWLASAFPAATFIFNTRALLPWLVSRHFHAQDSTHAFLSGHVKSLALHNDDATVACWVMQRDATLRQARQILGGRLAVLDITAAESDPNFFFTALQPFLPTRPWAGAPSIPHRGVGHAAALPPSRYDAIEDHIASLLKRMAANQSATGDSGARWTGEMLDACGRVYGMGGVGTDRRHAVQFNSSTVVARRDARGTSDP